MRSFISMVRCSSLAVVLVAPLALAITPAELSTRLARNDGVLVIDVRSTTAFAEGHIPGAINISPLLLPFKNLPASPLVVVCGDGLGVVDEAKALEVAKSRVGGAVEILAGGYAAWLAETRLTTAAPGVSRERIPGITYNQLLATAKADVVLVDLRGPPVAAAAHAQTAGAKTAAPATDVVDGFASKLGVPVVAAHPRTVATARAQTITKNAPTPASLTAAAVEALDKSGKLLVLVADDESVANETARELRARGNYRFTILIGGIEAISHEGRIGSDRMTSGVYAAPTKQ